MSSEVDADSSSSKMEGEVKPAEGQYHDKQFSISSTVDLQHDISSKREPTVSSSQSSGVARDVPSEPKAGGKTWNTSTKSQLGLGNFQFRVRKVTIEKDSSGKHSPTSSSSFHGQVTQPSTEDSLHKLRSPSVGDNKRNYHSETNLAFSNRVHDRINIRKVYPKPCTGQVKQFSDKSGMNEFYGSKKKSEGTGDIARGPRSNRTTTSSSSCAGKSNFINLIHTDQYNKLDFQTSYEHAKFFMIKSYSEVDIHKSIKYSVWASTPHGNKKLENAFRDAETVKQEKDTHCPVFLFFSVNTSGQFVGLAEMLGPVDFAKSMSFWQEEIWKGFFPLKWHIIKDIPNRLFQNIRLENNDNRPVTFSRDTQEIGLPQGLEMLQIFKEYTLETSVLDDFEYYEMRQKALIKSRISLHQTYDSGSSMSLEAAFSEVNVSGKNY